MGFDPAKQRLAITVAEQVGLAIANIKLREKLRNQSIRDPLTGLFNRRYLEESLERELHRAGRAGQPLPVIMLDVDHFKSFNDTFGHEAGDLVLREVGALLRNHTRTEDIACRYGGEEFILAMPGASSGDAERRAETLRATVKDMALEYRGASLAKIGLSLGVAEYPTHAGDVDALVRSADVALYQAKAKGRDRVVITEQTRT
jgi:diguanylate cyclase (GGDEF)-like protein